MAASEYITKIFKENLKLENKITNLYPFENIKLGKQ